MPDESADAGLLVFRRDAVATVMLNRPDRHNSLTRDLKVALRETIERLAVDDTVRAVVLTGAGSAFCSGQDLTEHAEALRADPNTAFETVQEHYNPIVRGLADMPKPVLAAINGTCVGAGLGFALACDLRIAVPDARFGTAFTRLGLSGDSGLTVTLADTVGAGKAAELLLLGDTFTAGEATSWGLLTKTVSAADLTTEADALADRLAAGPTAAYAEVKRALNAGRRRRLDEALRAEAAAQTRLGFTGDHRDAVEAFLAKQAPTFTGR